MYTYEDTVITCNHFVNTFTLYYNTAQPDNASSLSNEISLITVEGYVLYMSVHVDAYMYTILVYSD